MFGVNSICEAVRESLQYVKLYKRLRGEGQVPRMLLLLMLLLVVLLVVPWWCS